MKVYARLSALLMLGAHVSPALAQRTDLPPAAEVERLLDQHPGVMAGAARLDAARAQEEMLRRGSHEITLSGSYVRRSVDREGDYNEYEGTVSRAFRLPGKASLDREAGALGIEVAQNRMEDARHQAALVLAGLWYDWLTADALHRNDRDNVQTLATLTGSIRRRMQLRDAARLDLDQALTAQAQAAAQASSSLADREQARARLAAGFPGLTLPDTVPEIATPDSPAAMLEAWRDRVIADSHEIRAAEREAERLATLARRVRTDRIADPSLGVRLFRERDGMERGVGLVASIPLGGGYRRAAAEQAGAEAGAARAELAAAQRAVVATAAADLSNARTRAEVWRHATGAMATASSSLSLSERAYQAGMLDLAELLYARRQLNDARRAEILARSDAVRALVKLRIDAHDLWLEREQP